MVGIVIVGHCRFAEEMYEIVKTIVGTVDGICPVSFEQGENPEDSIKKVAAAIQQVDSGSGVLNDRHELVGLLFAGSDFHTLVNPIGHVRSQLRAAAGINSLEVITG